MIEILKAILLGIIEGITEWLPISSTGHMLLVDEFIKLNVTEEFKNMFMVVIQLGAIFAVILLYFQKLFPFMPSKTKREQMGTIVLWIKVLIASVPAAVIGLLFDDKIEANFQKPFTIALTLIIYGVLFIIIENRNENRRPVINKFSQLSYTSAFIIGIFQVLALIPGTSRSGATILGAILIGSSRYIATEFSFFLAIPVMFGASFLKIIKFGFEFKGMEIAILLTGMIVAFIVSIIAIRFLMGYIKKKDFKAFGYYRIILGIVVLAFMLFGIL